MVGMLYDGPKAAQAAATSDHDLMLAESMVIVTAESKPLEVWLTVLGSVQYKTSKLSCRNCDASVVEKATPATSSR